MAEQAAAARPPIPMRAPSQVMRLDRLGAIHQTRLSFLRAMLRRVKDERWAFDRPVWSIDGRGLGHAVYRMRTPERTYSLVCFSQDLPPEQRTDRVIAKAWDTSYTLFDGEPTAADIARLAANVPLQEAGRFSARELVLSRANKSVRLFDKVVDALADGRQPDADEIDRVGYLMRTTAVYGNGKLGMADRDVIAERPEFRGSYRAEMLTVWLIRSFTVDLVDHIAHARAPGRAVVLAPHLRRQFGIGNSTGLGMAPYLMRHPALVHRWFAGREEALARVRNLEAATPETRAHFRRVLGFARNGLEHWPTDDPVQARRLGELTHDLTLVAQQAAGPLLDQPLPWDALYRWGEGALTLEGQEYLVTLLLEPHGALIDDLADTMDVDEDASFRIDGSMRIAALDALIAQHYGWALEPDYGKPEAQARFWYTSVDKLEPRLGERWQEPGGELEQPLAIGRDMAALHAALKTLPPAGSVADFVMRQPQHRHVVRRLQYIASRPYGEIQDNLLGAEMRPIDLLRCKLACFGATRFDPRSDRWVRVNFFPGAPCPEELAFLSEDWVLGDPEGVYS